MSWCPVCNGLIKINKSCCFCQQTFEDLGKMSDYDEDYSPYRELDHLHLSNGYMDVAKQLCIHLCQCTSCGEKAMVAVEEKAHLS
jgi:hypothetical protein